METEGQSIVQASEDKLLKERLERFKQIVDAGVKRQRDADMVSRYSELVSKGTLENKAKTKAEPVKTAISTKVTAALGPVTYDDVEGENPGVEGLIEKPKSVQLKEQQEKLMNNSGSLDQVSAEDFMENSNPVKQPMSTIVKSQAESADVKVNNDVNVEKPIIVKEKNSSGGQAAKALKNADEKIAFKGLKKVGAYAAGALALAGLTSALISSKGQQTNNQLYGQQPLY